MRLALTAVMGWTALVAYAEADVKLPPLFSDHAVLQADQAVPVWGIAQPHESVRVSFGSQTKNARTDNAGKWSVTLDPLTSSDTAHILTIQGHNTIAINDVLVGEVWLCSGQSNMAFMVSKAKDFEREKSAGQWPAIRTFQADKWIICSPATVGAFSATAYFFGREIHQKTNRAVGLIHRSEGATPIEYWTSWDAQKDEPALQPVFADTLAVKADSAAQAKADLKQASEAKGTAPATMPAKKRPGCLFDERIAPLIPYAIRGAIWYQGEANSYTIHADLYGLQLATMIRDWRARWGYDFAFISVQLPDFQKPQTLPVELESGRAFVREGVFQSLSLPNTGMAVTLGTGEINSNHPKNKQEVGRRLACWALANVYGQSDVVPSGPLPQHYQISDNKVIITFTHVDGGLVARGDGVLRGFAIAGKDQHWLWADASIQGDTVAVSNAGVKDPVAVRYAWATNPQSSNLCNGAGLPATPFRTDAAPLNGSAD